MFGRVALARNDLDLHIFPPLIPHLQRSAVWRNDLHLQLAVSAVKLGVARRIGQRVLISNVVRDVAEQLWQFALEAWEISASAGHCGESAHLIVALQVIHVAYRNAHAMRVAAISWMHVTILAHDESY